MLYQLSYRIVMILQLLIDSNVTDRLMNGGNHSVQTERMTFGGYNCYRQTD